MMYLNPTRHFLERAQARHLTPEILSFILMYGWESRARGVTHVTVLRRHLLPELRDTSLARRALDWVVLMDDQDRLLTCYRRRNASRYLRKKGKARTSKDRQHERDATDARSPSAAAACG